MNSHLPVASAKWSEVVKSNSKELAVESINRFIDSYRLAKSFKSIKVEGYKYSNVNAYNNIFQLYLSYSALDILFKGIKQNKGMSKIKKSIYAVKVKDADLAIRLKKNEVFLTLLIENILDKTTKDELEKFRDEPSRTNMICIARGCRHLTERGEMSAAGSTAVNKKSTIDLKALSDLVLTAADNSFTEFVEALSKSLLKGLIPIRRQVIDDVRANGHLRENLCVLANWFEDEGWGEILSGCDPDT